MLKEKVELPSPDQVGPIHFKLSNGTVVTPDLILVAVGRKPNIEHLNLGKAGLPGVAVGSLIPQGQFGL
jgi:pyruvate/2-oxoglutarate dehydrogenase complex dihydrolipoamide dehydrogenase (E3) component